MITLCLLFLFIFPDHWRDWSCEIRRGIKTLGEWKESATSGIHTHGKESGCRHSRNEWHWGEVEQL